MTLHQIPAWTGEHLIRRRRREPDAMDTAALLRFARTLECRQLTALRRAARHGASFAEAQRLTGVDAPRIYYLAAKHCLRFTDGRRLGISAVRRAELSVADGDG